MAFVPQNFVDKVGPALKAAWLNGLDVLANSVFGGAQTNPAARTALTVDAAFEVANGGTGVRTLSALSAALGLDAIYGIDSGVVNAYVFTHSGGVAATLAVGTLIRLTVLATNTSSATLNADGSGAVAIIRANGSALTGGELSSLGPVVLQSTGTQWQVVSTAGAQPGFERTAAEIAAGVTPTNYAYPSIQLDVRRYNALGGGSDELTPLTQAFQIAALTNGFGTFQNKAEMMPGYHAISAGVTVTSGQTIEGQGVVNTKLEANYASSTGAPMLIYSSAPDSYLARLRIEGNLKASGIHITAGYYGVFDQCHFNGMGFSGTNGAYGFKASQAANVLRSCSFYFYNNVGDIAYIADGGSMQTLSNCFFDSRSIGVTSSGTDLSGVRLDKCTFAAQYPAIRIFNGDSLWDIQGCYFEGEAGQSSMTVIDAGSTNGVGGNTNPVNVNFERCQIAGTLVSDVLFNNGQNINFHNNEVGVNVTAAASVQWFYATGNYLAAGKTITNNAQFATIESRNQRIMASVPANAARVDTVDTTLGVVTSALTQNLGSYAQKVVDAGNYLWRVAGVTKGLLTSAADWIFNVNTSAPSLTVNQQMVFTLTSNTNLRISVRGTDGTTRVVNLTLA